MLISQNKRSTILIIIVETFQATKSFDRQLVFQ